jgi:hypothetical protein
MYKIAESVVDKRICNTCKKSKPITDFYKISRFFKNPTRNKERIETECKQCKTKKNRLRRIKLSSTPEGKAKVLEYYRNYYKKNPESGKLRRRKFASTPKGIYDDLRKRKGENIMSQNEFVAWYMKQNKKCHYCGVSEEEAKRDNYGKMSNRLNIDRKDNNKGYVRGNIVLACSLCNRIKNNFFTEQEMLKIAEIIKVKRGLI